MVRSVAGTCGDAEAAGEPEDAGGDDGEMEAGDDQHVKGAGALEADAQRVGQVSAVAGDHGGEHDGVVVGEAQRCWQAAHGGGESKKRVRRGVLQAAQTAGERDARSASGPAARHGRC